MNNRSFGYGWWICSILPLFLLLLESGCSEKGTACTPGATQQCFCTSGKKGAQTCDDNGSKWGKCTCSQVQDAKPDAPFDYGLTGC